MSSSERLLSLPWTMHLPPLSMPLNAWTVMGTLLLLPLSYWAAWCVYALYFHPLSKYPGPWLARVSQIWIVRLWSSGFYAFEMEKLHGKYGNVVRIAPNELSFRSPQSCKDIYGPASKTRKYFPKPVYTDNPDAGIIYERDPQRHAAAAKLYRSAFSTQALRDQEDIVHNHTDTLVKQLLRISQESGSVDMSEAVEWLAFDIIGELAFGESFGAVKAGKSHEWVSTLLEAIFGMAMLIQARRIALFKYVLPWLIPKAAVESYAHHRRRTADLVRKRIEIGDSNHREDIFANVIRTGAQSENRMVEEAVGFLIAGAETSATTITTCLYYLTRNPDCLLKLQAEIRSTFKSYQEITGDSLARLPYLNAVLEETMRVWPSVAIGISRISPGEWVDGIYVPAGFQVCTNMFCMNRDPENAPSPQVFDPERWLTEDGQRPFTAPFSLGPRMCMGINLAYLEMRVPLAKMVYALDWEFSPDPGDWTANCRLTHLWKKPALRLKFRNFAA